MSKTHLLLQSLFWSLTWGGLLYIPLSGTNTNEYAYILMLVIFSPHLITFFKSKTEKGIIKNYLVNFNRGFIPLVVFMILILLNEFTKETYIHLKPLKYIAALIVLFVWGYYLQKIWLVNKI